MATSRFFHLQSSVLFLLLSTAFSQNSRHNGDSCTTPNLEEGRCVSLDSCETYLRMLRTASSRSTTEFLRQAHCGFEDDRPIVCCPVSGMVQPSPTEDSSRPTSTPGETSTTGGDATSTEPEIANHPNWRYLKTDICGADASDRIVGGEEANLKEYPWLAALRYQTPSGLHFRCGGSLIGNRYVLTAAHCVTRLHTMTLVSVRLGEHNFETDPDCKTFDGEMICSDPAQDFGISEVIVHPHYQWRSRSKHHDIALLRLDREAPLTGYIIPICIPNGDVIGNRYHSENLTVVGWGITENNTASNVKLWVKVPVMTNTQCSTIYRRTVTLIGNQMCAGGVQGRDSCRGDSGGPLMTVDSVMPRRRGAQWVVAGIVSIGPKICGTGGLPGIYTRVGPYVKWILDNIKP